MDLSSDDDFTSSSDYIPSDCSTSSESINEEARTSRGETRYEREETHSVTSEHNNIENQDTNPSQPYSTKVSGIKGKLTACALDKLQSSEIEVLGVEKKSKKNCCYYCGKLVSKIGRHLSLHSTEKDIIKVSQINDRKKKDKKLKELRLLGNYRFNLECLEKGSGNLIVVRAPAFKCKASHFLPCPFCFGFMHRRELHKHCKHCSFNTSKSRASNPVEEAKLLLIKKFNPRTDELSKCVLNKLRNDNVKEKILHDNLILTFANSQMQRLRAAKGEKFTYLGQRLRMLGRLLTECEKTKGSPISLNEIIKPWNFDLLVQSVKNMTEGDKKPKSIGLKIGHAIRKCCIVAKCIAIKCGNVERKAEAQSFIELLDGEWTDLISSSLLRELYDSKLSKDSALPLTKDLQKLTTYINEKIRKALQDMSSLPNEEHYKNLAKAVVCKIVVFNKRRGGEVSRLTLTDFTNRGKWSSQKNHEILNSFSNLEKKLANKLDLIKVSGKRGRHVPILLTLDVTEAMNVLVSQRCSANIKESNVFFFCYFR